jgi:hypothetical protein
MDSYAELLRQKENLRRQELELDAKIQAAQATQTVHGRNSLDHASDFNLPYDARRHSTSRVAAMSSRAQAMSNVRLQGSPCQPAILTESVSNVCPVISNASIKDYSRATSSNVDGIDHHGSLIVHIVSEVNAGKPIQRVITRYSAPSAVGTPTHSRAFVDGRVLGLRYSTPRQ